MGTELTFHLSESKMDLCPAFLLLLLACSAQVTFAEYGLGDTVDLVKRSASAGDCSAGCAPWGPPMGAPMGAPMGPPMGPPMGQPMGPPMGPPMGQPMGPPTGRQPLVFGNKVNEKKYINCKPGGFDPRSLNDFTTEDIEKMNIVSFSDPAYTNKVLLVVNLASF